MTHPRTQERPGARLAGSGRVVAVLIAACVGLAGLGWSQQESVVNTRHNLSVSGPGPFRAAAEERICVFCHTPHRARDIAPLWNRNDSTATYLPYDSPTLKAQPGQPTGSSKLCLSCHDGTIALGDLVSEAAPIQMMGSQTLSGPNLIGTDLRDDHPISFLYSESLAALPDDLTPPGSWDPHVELDALGMLQCTTCHDAHNNQFGAFLVMDNIESMLCRQCHTLLDFDLSPHALSTNQWQGSGPNPWTHTDYDDVRSNACLNCHQPHHARGMVELVTHSREEDVCLICHNGNVAAADMSGVFQKPYRHPVEATTGVHEPGESPLAAYDHVECVDCHNPHQARLIDAEPPLVMGVLEGVSGIDATGLPVDTATFEYEVCFKCHAQDSAIPFNAIPRQVPSTNLRKSFSTSSPSFHPVEIPRGTLDVPSLITPTYGPDSVLYCSDCHGNNDPTAETGGLAGPHGSDFEYLLVRNYTTGPSAVEGPTTYDLCYGCHDRASIIGNESFPYHFKHIVEENAPCSVCHDPHGIDPDLGNSTNNAFLINFDLSVVEKDSVTQLLEYRSLGPQQGECYLRCHNADHSPKVYPEQ